MQHHLGIAAEQARGVGAHGQILVDALGGVTGDEILRVFVGPTAFHMGKPYLGKRLRKPSGVAAQVPRSVIRPVTSRAGVTSKPGLAAPEPGAAISTTVTEPSGSRPDIFSTSSWLRSSIGMSRPDSRVQSMVALGSAT